MQFLADVFVPCDQCDGKRFKPQVLEVRYRGPIDSPGARPDGARGADVLQQLAEGAAPAAGARRDRPRLPAPRPAGDDAVGRRGAADQDRGASVVAQRRAAAVHPRRADDRPALRRHRQAADGVPEAARGRAHAARHRAQPRRDQDGRLHHRSRTRRRRGRRPRSSPPGTPEQVAQIEASHTGRYLRPVLAGGTFACVRVRGGRAGRSGWQSRRAGWRSVQRCLAPIAACVCSCPALPGSTPAVVAAAGLVRAGDAAIWRAPTPATRLQAAQLLKAAAYPEAAVPLRRRHRPARTRCSSRRSRPSSTSFSPSKIVPKKRVGLRRRSPHADRGRGDVLGRAAGARRAPVPLEVLTALRTAARDDNPRVGARSAVRVRRPRRRTRRAPRGASCCGVGGPNSRR